MASNEGHIHWTGSRDEEVTYLNQALRITAEVSNATVEPVDPRGSLRIRLTGFVGTALLVPTEGWQAVPGTVPVLEVRADAHYPAGFIRIRQA